VPGPVWTGAENLAPTWIRSPDSPARIQSLYGLRCPAHAKWVLVKMISMSNFFKPYSQVRISPSALMDIADDDTPDDWLVVGRLVISQ